MNIIYSKLKKLLSILGWLIYFFLQYRKISKILSQNKCLGAKPFLIKKWHHGYAYLTAFINNEKVFIKIDARLGLLKNEITFYELMSEHIESHLIPVKFYSDFEGLQAVCYPYIDDYVEINSNMLINDKAILNDMLHIIKKMKISQVIHRDIKLDNFILQSSGLKIIDFTFANSFNKDKSSFKEIDITKTKNIDILMLLGKGYKPGMLCWNDSISLVKVIEDIISSNRIEEQRMTELNKIIDELILVSKNSYYTV